jgi:hypothetical protein
MRKPTAVALASALSLLPLVWLGVFAVTYRCDLQHYARLWSAGEHPAWVTAWTLALTLAAALLAAMLAPKILRLWRTHTPLTRGEWLVLSLMPMVLVLLIMISPAAMIDPGLQIKAFMGEQVDQCRH